jgi:hypothetical protein
LTAGIFPVIERFVTGFLTGRAVESIFRFNRAVSGFPLHGRYFVSDRPFPESVRNRLWQAGQKTMKRHGKKHPVLHSGRILSRVFTLAV